MISGENPVVPVKERVPAGVVVPIPTLPPAKTVRNVGIEADEEAMVKIGVVEPATFWIETRDEGVDVGPTAMFPFDLIAKMLFPDVEATTKASLPVTPVMLKVTVADVALTPKTVPLSIRAEIPRVSGVAHRAAKPACPPATPPATIDDVATQSVEVPVERRICP